MKKTNNTARRLKLTTDSSSLITLYHAELLKRAGEFVEFIVAEPIWQELLRGSSENELQCYKELSLIVSCKKKPAPSWRLKEPDWAVVALYYDINVIAVLSEDGKILRRCKDHHIPHLCALSLCSFLYQKQCWTLHETKNALGKLEKVGRYSQWVCKEAHRLLSEPFFHA